MNTAPLNIFQKLMRKWEADHPYNAAQVMKIAGAPDVAKLNEAWHAALSSTGIGCAVVHGDRYHFQPLTDRSIGDVTTPSANLDDHITAELNCPFDSPAEFPFRPFIIIKAGHFYAGVIYQHWIADSVSIRALLREWFVRVFDPTAATATPLKLSRHGYWKTVGPPRGRWGVVESVLGMTRRLTRLRQVRKIDGTNLDDHHTQFILFPAPDGLITALRTAAKKAGVKLNDVFLAALTEAAAQHVPLQYRANRADLAVGSIVDLRPYCPDNLTNTFGLFLGFTNVICRPCDIADFNRLVRVVANQTRLQKNIGVAPASLMWMCGALWVGKLSRPGELYRWYRKDIPLAAGNSNVDLTHAWPGHYSTGPLLDYIRASPSGPMTPLVITTTTVGERFHIGVTFRTGLISAELAETIAGTILSRLAKFAE